MSVPTEILGISKLYSISSSTNSERYNEIVKTLQELKILDVAHVVRRGLEEDPSGSWSALKKATDDDLTAAKKFVEDLNTFLTSLERLIDSLDISTPKDGFNEKFVDFLSGKTADGLTPPAARDSSIVSVANVVSFGSFSDLTNVDLISLILHAIRVRSTGVEDNNAFDGQAAFVVLYSLGQKEPYDYNDSRTTRSPRSFIRRNASEYLLTPLGVCVYALSNMFNLSAGITRLKRIQSEFGLSVSSISDADKVFDGVKVTDIEFTGFSPTNVLYQRSLDEGDLGSNSYALKVARYDDGANKIAPCEKPINIAPETRYTSGETSLIRGSMAENDFNFQKLSLYTAQLESSLEQLQKVTESLVGFMDAENELTPPAVLSRILEASVAALGLADQDDLNKYQLLTLMELASASDSTAPKLERYLVLTIVSLKSDRVTSNAQSKAGSESSKSTVTLETSRTSEGSGSVQADASVKTVETLSSTRDSSGDGARVISRAGSDDFTALTTATGGATLVIVDNSSNPDVYNPVLDALLESSRKEGTIFSLMLDLYDELTTKSSNRAGENETITDGDGYTNYGKMDEYAILSLIISCFSEIFASVMPPFNVVNGTFTFDPGALVRAQTSIKNSLATGGGDQLENTDIDSLLYKLRKYVETYQNGYAFLDAYLKNIKESRLLAISNFSEVSKDLSFTSDAGRLRSLANVTSHGVALRRALLRKWEPIETSGYLSRFSSKVVPVDSYIKTLRSSNVPNTYEDNSLQNMRVLHVGVPASTIVSDSVGGTQFINVVVRKLDHRYYLPDTFIEKSFIFDPALFVGDLGVDVGFSMSTAPSLPFYFFDRNGPSGPYTSDQVLARYIEVNPSADVSVLESVILNCYNSAIIEAYQYYTSGIVLDESTATGVDTSISPAGLNALSLLSGLNLPDVSLPPGAAISSAFSDGHINFEETASGLSSSKKEILSNVASSYLFKSNRILERIARNFDHDRVFLIPVDPDSFLLNPTPDFISTFGTENLREGEGARAQLTDQDPTNNGMMAGSFYAQILEYLVAVPAAPTIPDDPVDEPEPEPEPDPSTPPGGVGGSAKGIPSAPTGGWGGKPPDVPSFTPKIQGLDFFGDDDEGEDPRDGGPTPTVSAAAAGDSAPPLKKFNPRL